VDGSDVAVATAAEQFLGRGRNEIMAVAQQTIEGHLRAILGTMKVEEIYKNREMFAQKVQDICSADTANMGLRIISFTLRDIKDQNGYLDALGKPRLAEVKRDAAMREAQMTSEAQIAQAEANRDAAIKSAQAKQAGDIAKYEAEAGIAAANRTYEIKRAEYVSEVNQKKAEADLAYDLQRYKTQQLVKKEEIQVSAIEKEQQIVVQEKEILRREKELEATVQKPADAKKYATQVEAEAERYRITAEAQGRADAAKAAGLAEADVIRARGNAEAEAIRMKGLAEAEVTREKGLAEAQAMAKKAESFQAYNSAAVLQMFVEMMPKLAEAIAAPLAKTEKIVIVSGGEGGGASKLTKDVAAMMAQLPPVIESLSGVKLEDLVGRIQGLAPKAAVTPSAVEPPPESLVVRK
jgi:flotillin